MKKNSFITLCFITGALLAGVPFSCADRNKGAAAEPATTNTQNAEPVTDMVATVAVDSTNARVSPAVEKHAENTEQPYLNDSIILDHFQFINLTLSPRVLDTACICALEYYKQHGKMPSRMDELYEGGFHDSSTLARYSTEGYGIDLHKENEMKSVITVTSGGTTYTAVYERKDLNVFSLYQDGKLHRIVYRDDGTGMFYEDITEALD